jgi:Flp pilus assembly pilin Flp
MDTMLKGLAHLSALVATKDVKRDEKGAAFTEYVVLLAVIVAVVVGLLWILKTPLSNAIDGVVTKLNGAGNPPATP